MHSLATRQVGTRSALAGKAVIVAGRNPRTIRTIQYLPGVKRGNPDIDPLHKRGHTIRHASTSTQVERENSPTGDLPASTDLLELYRGWVAQGRLRWDDEQVRCVMKVSLIAAPHPPQAHVC